jgi:hypothetical protein
VRKLKIFFLMAFAAGIICSIGTGCSKSNNNNSSSSTDSIQYSAWIPVVMKADPGDTTFEQNVTAKSITQNVLDKATILTYVEYQGAVNYASDFGVFPTFSVGNINLFAGFNGTGLSFRYVIIPGKTLVTDYKTIVQKYNIPAR